MEIALAMIDRIIEEHETIKRHVQNLERQANDIEAIEGLEKVEESFQPDKLQENQGLQKLQAALQTVLQGLQAHFNREETGLLVAFEKYGNRKLTTAFTTLLIEHEDLRNYFTRSRKDISELIAGGLSRQAWETKVRDMQAHVSRTCELLETHAGSEMVLLHELRSGLKTQGGN